MSVPSQRVFPRDRYLQGRLISGLRGESIRHWESLVPAKLLGFCSSFNPDLSDCSIPALGRVRGVDPELSQAAWTRTAPREEHQAYISCIHPARIAHTAVMARSTHCPVPRALQQALREEQREARCNSWGSSSPLDELQPWVKGG